MVDADKLRDANPWHPIDNKVDLKHLGKLAEELGECCAAVSRCIIQGIDEVEPVTGKLNREWLEDELSDVIANAELNIERFRLDRVKMEKRIKRKMQDQKQWHPLA